MLKNPYFHRPNSFLEDLGQLLAVVLLSMATSANDLVAGVASINSKVRGVTTRKWIEYLNSLNFKTSEIVDMNKYDLTGYCGMRAKNVSNKSRHMGQYSTVPKQHGRRVSHWVFNHPTFGVENHLGHRPEVSSCKSWHSPANLSVR